MKETRSAAITASGWPLEESGKKVTKHFKSDDGLCVFIGSKLHAVCRYVMIHRGEVSPGGTVSVEVWWAKHEEIPDLKCFLWSPSESALDGDEEKEFEDVFMELVEI